MKRTPLVIAVMLLAHGPVQAQSQQSIIYDFFDETQFFSDDPERDDFVWWMPPSLWKLAFPEEYSKVAAELLDASAPYIIILATDGHIDIFGTRTPVEEAKLRESLQVVDADGMAYRPIPKGDVDPNVNTLLASIMPMFNQRLGGDFHFFLFPARSLSGEVIADETSDGFFEIVLGERRFRISLPLASLLERKRCPIDGKLLNGSWTYCPWHGAELEGTSRSEEASHGRLDTYRVPSVGMEPTIRQGEIIRVDTRAYTDHTPSRGDIITFWYPLPVLDKPTLYAKRVIGLPGETIQIIDKSVYINGEPVDAAPSVKQWWNVYMICARCRISNSTLTELGIDTATEVRYSQNDLSLIQLVGTTEAIEEIRRLPPVERVEPFVTRPNPEFRDRLYPSGSDYTTDNYGPVVIPGKDVSFELTESNWSYLEPIIRLFEGRATGRVGEGEFFVDDARASVFTFTQEYYFLLGDFRDNSEDSRFFGLIPRSLVTGKVLSIYSSETPARVGLVLED